MGSRKIKHRKHSIIRKRALCADICACFVLSLCAGFGSGLSAQSIPTAETDDYLSSCWHIESMDCVGLWQKLDEIGRLPGQDVVVAVIDTGLDMKCRELENAVWCNRAELDGEAGVDDDGNGYVDDIYGVNLVNTFPDMTDTQGHGTQMAGIIAMQPYNGGGVGIAYGAKIMPIKASVDTNFSIDALVEGIHYAVDMGADVINLSLGTYRYSKELEEAVNEAAKSCVIVASAGNERYVTDGGICDKGELAAEGYRIGMVYPAALQSCLGVMAYDRNGGLADFSNWDQREEGDRYYDVIAPGQTITTIGRSNQYVTSSGTSQATAAVSAAVAVLKSMVGDAYSATELREIFVTAMTEQTVFYFRGQRFAYPRCSLASLEPYLSVQKPDEGGNGDDSGETETTGGGSGDDSGEMGTTGGGSGDDSGEMGTTGGGSGDNSGETETTGGGNGGDSGGTGITTAPGNAVSANKKIEFTRGKLSYQLISEKRVKVIGCKNKKLTRVKIPDTIKYKRRRYKVTSIGKKAFYKCRRLKDITIGKNVTTIQKKAFFGIHKKAVFHIKGSRQHRKKIKSYL